MNRNKEQIQYFSTKDDGTMIKIIVSAVVFHLVVVFVLYGLHCIDTSKPAKEIPVFELVQIDEPVKQPVVAETPLEPENETPKEEIPPEPPKEEIVPEVPVETPKEELPPEPVVETPAEPVVENPPPELPPETPPEPVPETVTSKEPAVEPTPEKKLTPEAPPKPEEKPAPEMKPDTPKPVPVPKKPPQPEKVKPVEKAKPEKNKPVEKPAKKVVEKKTETKPAKKPKEKDDFDINDLDLPKSFELPSLKAVNPIDMDPLMQVFLERAKQKIMSNFNPPNGLSIPRDAKTTVQFSVERSGQITAVLLKRSSSNSTWDHLSVRAVKISKLPELPPTYSGSSLVLQFNFTPN
ncbi:energy transducer TonB [Fibrobacter sp.]|uniref:energy transducer TonB n=1 Tax=Fibrobacter sp. TaxID=35828 RepID=UPI0025BB0C53|nr:energy transducer TonB [Fibrobacter sp.]